MSITQRCFNVDIWLKIKFEPTYVYRRFSKRNVIIVIGRVFCCKNTKNHNLQLNLSNSYFVLIILISLVRAKSVHSWDTY